MPASEVFCNNCGHRNALGATFCSSCGAILEPVSSQNTTITFHPVTPGDPIDEAFIATSDEFDGEYGVLVVHQGAKAGSRIVLDSDLTTAGRHPDSDLFLDDITVSRRHAEIRRSADGTYEVSDTGSLNGTYLNRERIEHAALRSGDELQIGKFKLVFLLGEAESGA
jgi:pSer/pThr/pTyr-binding forkhead associated (FHA) protein